MMPSKNSNTTTAKRKRNSTNSPAARPVRNIITLDAIPNNRVFMLGNNGHIKHPYDVHGLADMVHHDMYGRLTEQGRPNSRVPHTREVMNQETINAILNKARKTGWTPPTTASMQVTANNRRVPPNLAAALASARDAIAAGLERQRMSIQVQEEVKAVLQVQSWFRRVSREIARMVGEAGLNVAVLKRASDYVQDQSKYFHRNTPSSIYLHNPLPRVSKTGKFTVDFNNPSRDFPPISLRAQITPSGVNVLRVDIGRFNDEIISIKVVGDLRGENFNWKNVHTWSAGHYSGLLKAFMSSNPETRRQRRQMRQHASFMDRIFTALGASPVAFDNGRSSNHWYPFRVRVGSV